VDRCERALIQLEHYLEMEGARPSLAISRLIELAVTVGIPSNGNIYDFDEYCPDGMDVEHWRAAIETVLLEFIPDSRL
jgi:hypothetical protein